MSKREQRVIQAFVNCVKSGQYSFDYKESFYAEFENEEQTEVEEAAEV